MGALAKNKVLLVAVAVLVVVALVVGGILVTRPPEERQEVAEKPEPVDEVPVVKEAPLEEVELNEFGWAVPEETIVITDFMGEGFGSVEGTPIRGDQDLFDEFARPLHEFLLEHFNVDYRRTVRPGVMDENLRLMLATGDYPEVIAWMSDALAEEFIAQGRAVELTPYIEEYGPNITRRLGEQLDLLRTGDGKLYKLPVNWGVTPNPAGWDFAVRHDWWKEAGLPLYRTPEEFYEVLKDLMERHPYNELGEKVYALSDNSNGRNLLGAMLGAYGFVDGFRVNEATGTFTHWINTDEGLEIARYINRFYREGMIDPDFIINTWEDWNAMVTGHRIIGNIGIWWHMFVAGHEAWGRMYGAGLPVEQRFMNVSVAAPDVERDTLITYNFLGDARAIITDKAVENNNVANIMKWWNWEMTELAHFIVTHGPPHPDNVWNIENGKWMFHEKTFDALTKLQYYHEVRDRFGGRAFWTLAAGGIIEHENIDPRITRVSGWDFWPIAPDGEFLDPGVRISWGYSNAQPFDTSLFTVTWRAGDPITVTNATITDTIVSEWAEIITSPTEAAMEERFMEARERLNELGVPDLEEFRAEVYRANREKLN